MRFTVNRMGEQYADVTLGWLASIVSMAEYERIRKMKVGDKISYSRVATAPAGKPLPLEIERTA